jgi:hypothetical protein
MIAAITIFALPKGRRAVVVTARSHEIILEIVIHGPGDVFYFDVTVRAHELSVLRRTPQQQGHFWG